MDRHASHSLVNDLRRTDRLTALACRLMTTVIIVDVVVSFLALAVASSSSPDPDGVELARIAYALFVVVQIATAIALAAWSQRTVDNVILIGGEGSRAMASFGWLIPVGHLVLPFLELGTAARSIGADHPARGRWHGAFVAAFVATLLPFSGTAEMAFVCTAASIVLLVIAARSARTAMQHLDDTIYDRARAGRSGPSERREQGAVDNRSQV
ncbi:MAG: hypothetical protein M3337_05315 [Actinomycetota bacterium]|nr:hypothetical protein [Actinomycetota bacterium]